MMKKSNIEFFFDQIAANYEGLIKRNRYAGPKWVVQQLDKLESLNQNRRKIKILDVCCGPGHFGKVLKTRIPNSEIKGLDFSASMLRLANAKGHYDDLIWQNLESASPLEVKGKFDLVLFMAATEFLPKPLQNLDFLVQQLKATGHIFFSFQEIPSFSVRIDQQRSFKTTSVSFKKVRQHLEKLNLEIVHHELSHYLRKDEPDYIYRFYHARKRRLK